MRVLVCMSEEIPVATDMPREFWWRLPDKPKSVKDFLAECLRAVQVSFLSSSELDVLVDGYPVMLESLTNIFNDRDSLILRRKQITRVCETSLPHEKAPLLPPAHPAPRTNGLDPRAKRGPSRSARRKAAKRRWRRMGYLKTASPPQHQQSAEPTPVTIKSGKKQVSSESESEDSTVRNASTESATSTDDSSAETSSDETSSEVDDTSLDNLKTIEENFETLKRCTGIPGLGSVVAYKLLEIGDKLAPQVSEIRQGKVVGVDQSKGMITLCPHPDPTRHPIRHKFVDDKQGNSESAELDPYDESGMLQTEMSFFVDIRYVEERGEEQKLTDGEPLGPERYCQLGPPRPRSEEKGNAPESKKRSHPSSIGKEGQNARWGKCVRHRSALQSAIGPVLRLLRET